MAPASAQYQRIDYAAFKQGDVSQGNGYKLQIPKDGAREKHYLDMPVPEDTGTAKISYYLEDIDGTPATDLSVDFIDPNLKVKVHKASGLSKALNSAHKYDIYTFNNDYVEEENGKTYIAVFMAKDSHKANHRDHLPKNALATNSHTKFTHCPMNTSRLNQDDPGLNSNILANYSQTVSENDVIYGGSIPSTSDNIRLTASMNVAAPFNNGFSIIPDSKYLWYVKYKAPGKKSFVQSKKTPYRLSETSSNVKKLEVLPKPGRYIFGSRAHLTNNSIGVAETPEIEVGIRTDDVIIVAYFDKRALKKPTMQTMGVRPQLLRIMPPLGPTRMRVNDVKKFANITKNLLFNVTYTPVLVEDPDDPAMRLSVAERIYIMNWMLYYSADSAPPRSLKTPQDKFIDYAAIGKLIADNRNYRMINHLQIKYRVNKQNTGFASRPLIISGRNTRQVGVTKVPGGIQYPIYSFGSNNSASATIGINAQRGPANGLYNNPRSGFPAFTRAASRTRVSSIVDGAVDVGGVLVANALMASELPAGVEPKFVEEIGSQIRFQFNNGTKPIANSGFYQQVPAYAEYHNGVLTNRGHPMPPTGGIMLFASVPFPFGAGAPTETSTSFTSWPEIKIKKRSNPFFNQYYKDLNTFISGGRYGLARVKKKNMSTAVHAFLGSHYGANSIHLTDPDETTGTPTFVQP